MAKSTLKPHPAFELVQDHVIDSLGVHAFLFRHRVTQAYHLHLASDEEENVFMVAFRTMPEDSSGVAHVLEHTALCGSKDYPVRDPFFMMLRRSLSTFMNAFTSSDWTAYPFASKNSKDFDHLLSIYLDAAFFPNLNPLDFAQEGHRLAFEDPKNTDSPLSHHGVVYNEMKGAMSDPISQLWQHISSYLYPTTTYHHNSGGEPQKIVDLTHAQLKAFFKTHYHPTNAIFLTFGNRAPELLQGIFNDKINHFKQPLSRRFQIPDEQRYPSPLTISCGYPSSRTEKQTHIVLGWLADLNSDVDDFLDWSLLSELLLNNSASPLRQALDQYPHAEASSSLSGLASDQREMAFICGVEGSDAEHADGVEKLVMRVLRHVAREGFDAESVAAILQQLTLSQREIRGSRYPYGLQLILRALPALVDYADPMPFLDLDPALARLSDRVSDPEYLKNFVKKKLLENTHRVLLTMRPDDQYMARLRSMESERLKAIADAMDDKSKSRLQEANRRLMRRQNQVDDLSCLPTLLPSDIPKHIREPDVPKSLAFRGNQFHVCHPRTNGLVYQEVIIPLSGLDASFYPFLPYYASLLNELGCGHDDYKVMQQRQSRHLGSLSAYLSLNTAPEDVGSVSGMLVMSAKALSAHQQPMSSIMSDILENIRFDEHNRILELIAEWRLDHEQSITASGHSMAMLAASSAWRDFSAWQHGSGGLLGVNSIQNLHQKIQNKKEIMHFAQTMADLHAWVKSEPRSVLWMGEESLKKNALTGLTDTFSASTFVNLDRQHAKFDVRSKLSNKQQIWLLDTKVNFSGKAYPAVGYDHPDAPLLSVLASVMTHGYLHGAIRERGGAYGGGASFASDAGVFRFYAYRDPRLQATFDDFERAIDWVFSSEFTDRHVSEAILSVISSIDKPSSPVLEASKVFYNSFYGRSITKREAYRRSVMGATRDQIKRVAETYLRDQEASVATVTSKDQAKKLSWQDVSEVDLA
jgi:presequence protease